MRTEAKLLIACIVPTDKKRIFTNGVHTEPINGIILKIKAIRFDVWKYVPIRINPIWFQDSTEISLEKIASNIKAFQGGL